MFQINISSATSGKKFDVNWLSFELIMKKDTFLSNTV